VLWGTELEPKSQVNPPFKKVSKIILLGNGNIQAFAAKGNKSVTIRRPRYTDGTLIPFRVYLRDEDAGVMTDWAIEDIQSIDLLHHN
jgi:hypothetical protein